MYIKTSDYDSLKKEVPSIKKNKLNGVIVSYEEQGIRKKDIITNGIIDASKIITIDYFNHVVIDETDIVDLDIENDELFQYHKCYCTKCNYFYEVVNQQRINLKSDTLKDAFRFNYMKVKKITYIDDNGSKELTSDFKYDYLSCPKCNESTFYFDVSFIEKAPLEIDALYIVNTEDEFKLSFYGKNHHIFEKLKEETFDKDFIFFHELENPESIERYKKSVIGKTIVGSFYKNKYRDKTSIYLSKTNYKHQFIYKKKTNKLITYKDNSFQNIKYSIYGEYLINSLLSSLLMFVSNKEIVNIVYSLFEEIVAQMPSYQRKKINDTKYLSDIKNELESIYKALNDSYGDYSVLNKYKIGQKFKWLLYIKEYPFYQDFYNDFKIPITRLKENVTQHYFNRIVKESNNSNDVIKVLYPSMNKKVVNEFKLIHKKYKEDNVESDALNLIAYLVLSSNNKGFVEKELMKHNKLLLHQLKIDNALHSYQSGKLLNRKSISSILKYFNFTPESFIALINKTLNPKLERELKENTNEDDYLNQYEYDEDYYLYMDIIDMMFEIKHKINYLKSRKESMEEEILYIFEDNLKHFKTFLKSKKTTLLDFNNKLLRFDICFSQNNHVVYDNYLEEDREKEFKMECYSLELPKTYVELADSALKMHICAASYTERIEKRESVLYYLYKNKKPIVCIEYNPKLNKVVQVKKSFNKLILKDNKEDISILNFIRKWKTKNSINFETNDINLS